MMSVVPDRYVILDTETKSAYVESLVPTKELTLRLGVALVIDRSGGATPTVESHRFTTADMFHATIDMMPLGNKPIYVFAHNMGFDCRIVEWFRYVATGQYTLLPPEHARNSKRYKDPLFIPESPPFIVRLWRRDGQQIMLLDTVQWLKLSLKDIGEMIQEPKGKMPDESSSDEEWFEYCEQDCRSLLKALHRLWSLLDGLNCKTFAATPAGTSMLLYKTRFEKKRIKRCDIESVMSFERQGYYAGYVEAFKVGLFEALTYQLDVTSLYPSVMKMEEFPCEVHSSDLDAERREVGSGFDPRISTAEVWLETSDTPYPVRGSDSTMHCIGHVRTILAGPELSEAFAAGHVRYIGRWIRYECKPLFREWIDWLWGKRASARRSGDKFASHIYKQLLNSLHGKFGQRDGEWEYTGKEYPTSHYGCGKVVGARVHDDRDYRVLAGHRYERCRDHEDPASFVPIASWTASYGRVSMATIRALAGEKDVLYQATDSLLVNGEGMGQLQLSGMVNEFKLGHLRHEATHEWVHIGGIHHVDLPNRLIRSGIKRFSHQHTPNVFEVEEWESFADAIFRGNVSSTFIKTIAKTARPKLKRRVIGGTNDTEPWVVDNWHIRPEDQRLIPVRQDR